MSVNLSNPIQSVNPKVNGSQSSPLSSFVVAGGKSAIPEHAFPPGFENAGNGETKIPSVPYGLDALLNNCIARNSKMLLLKNGFIDDETILVDYEKMRIKMNGKRSCLMTNESGEVVTFNTRSRWNSEFDYGGHVGRKLLEEVEGLDKCSHLVLTLDPKKFDSYIPGWWCFGDREFLSVSIGFLVGEFLRQLRIKKKRRREPWNFIAWVMEFQQSGIVHVHLMFAGGWIAPLPELISLWPYAEGQGVHLGKRKNYPPGQCSGKAVAGYLTHYLAKDLNAVSSGEFRPSKHSSPRVLSPAEQKDVARVLKRCAAFIWFFGRRLYNVRHHFVTPNGNRSWGLSASVYLKKWKRYVSPSEEKVLKIIEGVAMTGNLKQDYALIAAMPVRYPVPKFGD